MSKELIEAITDMREEDAVAMAAKLLDSGDGKDAMAAVAIAKSGA